MCKKDRVRPRSNKDGNKELKHLIPLFQQSPEAHFLQTLFHEIGRTLGYSHLGEQINNMWIQLDDNAKADLIEWLDQLLKKEHIKGVGIILERDLKREKRALNVTNS